MYQGFISLEHLSSFVYFDRHIIHFYILLTMYSSTCIQLRKKIKLGNKFSVMSFFL